MSGLHPSRPDMSRNIRVKGVLVFVQRIYEEEDFLGEGLADGFGGTMQFDLAGHAVVERFLPRVLDGDGQLEIGFAGPL